MFRWVAFSWRVIGGIRNGPGSPERSPSSATSQPPGREPLAVSLTDERLAHSRQAIQQVRHGRRETGSWPFRATPHSAHFTLTRSGLGVHDRSWEMRYIDWYVVLLAIVLVVLEVL